MKNSFDNYFKSLDDFIKKNETNKVSNCNLINKKDCDNCKSKKFVITGGIVPIKYCNIYDCPCNQITECNNFNK